MSAQVAPKGSSKLSKARTGLFGHFYAQVSLELTFQGAGVEKKRTTRAGESLRLELLRGKAAGGSGNDPPKPPGSPGPVSSELPTIPLAALISRKNQLPSPPRPWRARPAIPRAWAVYALSLLARAAASTPTRR